MGNFIKTLLLLLLFISCKEDFFLVENELQLKRVTDAISYLDWEITKIDTFWNLDGKSILRYRVTCKPNKMSQHEVDSLIIIIKYTFL